MDDRLKIGSQASDDLRVSGQLKNTLVEKPELGSRSILMGRGVKKGHKSAKTSPKGKG